MNYLDGVMKDTLNTLNELIEIENKDKSYFNVVKGVLLKMYDIASVNNIEDIYVELKDLEFKTDEQLLEKLIKIRDILKSKSIDKNRVLIFPDGDEKLDDIIKRLKQEDIEVVVSKGDAVDTILSYNPNLVIIQNNKYINALTILKSIREEKILDQLPIIIISDRDYDAKIEFLKLGAVDCIEYDFDLQELYLKILNLINMSSKCLKNAVYDLATGLYVKRQGEVLANSIFLKTIKEDIESTLLLIDFDNMSEINKKMGISVGNSIIKNVVSEFKKYTTKVDIAYRIAGDEFAFIFYDRDIKWVKSTAEDVLDYAANIGNQYGIKVSFSGGITSLSKDNSDFKEAYIKAKDALSRAKIEGRARIVLDVESLKKNKLKNILFVDDDKIILSILKSRYKNKGYNVYTASDGTEALKIIQENKIDVIVTDFYMKLMNGDELIKKVREKNKEVAIIVLSAQKNEAYIKMALDAGADDYIVKPFSPVELDSRIKKLLD